jgi:ankyrin repeat protein
MAALQSDRDCEAFGEALLSGDVKSVHQYLLNGYSPNMHLDWTDATPLMYCELNPTRQTKAECQQLLLEYGAVQTATDMFGHTAESTRSMMKPRLW